MMSNEQQRAVDAAITTRRSIRAYLPTPVAREDIEAILQVSARAPSGSVADSKGCSRLIP